MPVLAGVGPLDPQNLQPNPEEVSRGEDARGTGLSQWGEVPWSVLCPPSRCLPSVGGGGVCTAPDPPAAGAEPRLYPLLQGRPLPLHNACLPSRATPRLGAHGCHHRVHPAGPGTRRLPAPPGYPRGGEAPGLKTGLQQPLPASTLPGRLHWGLNKSLYQLSGTCIFCVRALTSSRPPGTAGLLAGAPLSKHTVTPQRALTLQQVLGIVSPSPQPCEVAPTPSLAGETGLREDRQLDQAGSEPGPLCLESRPSAACRALLPPCLADHLHMTNELMSAHHAPAAVRRPHLRASQMLSWPRRGWGPQTRGDLSPDTHVVAH